MPITFVVESLLDEAKLDVRFVLAKMTPLVKCVEHNGVFKGHFGGLSEKVGGPCLRFQFCCEGQKNNLAGNGRAKITQKM